MKLHSHLLVHSHGSRLTEAILCDTTLLTASAAGPALKISPPTSSAGEGAHSHAVAVLRPPSAKTYERGFLIKLGRSDFFIL